MLEIKKAISKDHNQIWNILRALKEYVGKSPNRTQEL